MSKKQKIESFNPNDAGNYNLNIFGLPFTTEESEVVIIPVPWEVTVSYSPGTADGPEAILEASYQIDLLDPFVEDAWKLGISIEPVNAELKSKSSELRIMAEEYIDLLTSDELKDNQDRGNKIISTINKASAEMISWVRSESLRFLDQNKIVATLGGDHSTPLGLIQAVAEKHSSFSILQLDAHADLRDSYEGFEYSHASIMYNALKIPQVKNLVQVGIRDYCQEEVDVIRKENGRVVTYFDRDIKYRQFNGETLKAIYEDIILNLEQDVFISFDIDALDPKLCPNTGTPVPGGFEFEQALFILEKVVESGRRIIGFDLNEVAPGDDELDANVAGRLLYRISNLAARSQKRI